MLSYVIAVSVAVINMGYLFEGSFGPLGQYRFLSRYPAGIPEGERVPGLGANRFCGTVLEGIRVPLPSGYVQGIDTQRHDFERGLPSYIRGQWADHGWWYYYSYALAVKMPLGTWCLLLVATALTIADLWGKGTVPLSSDENRGSPQQRYSASWRDEMVVLVPGLAILVFVSSQTGFSVHSRYVIPALPFLFVWISKVGRVFEMRPFTRARVGLSVAVVAAATWSVGSSLWAYPHSLSYFSELVGGPRGGGEHLLDSNIDWGQDLFYLDDWLDQHPETKLDGLAYWGSCPPALAGIPETPMPPSGLSDELDGSAFGPRNLAQSSRENQYGPRPGWYALSVNYIHSRDRQYRYFLKFDPAAMAGYSIYIYHITIDEANQVRRELGLDDLAQNGRSRDQ